MITDEEIKATWEGINKALADQGINERTVAFHSFMPDQVKALFNLQNTIDEKWLAFRQGKAKGYARPDIKGPLSEDEKGVVDHMFDWWNGWTKLIDEVKSL